MSALVGLYSFPKSGNTWLRAILAHALAPEGVPDLHRSRRIPAVPDLHKQALDGAAELNGFRFFKHHGGRNFRRWQGTRLETTHVIHIRRNPLDVFLSYLNFLSDNVTGTAPIPFASVEAIRGTELFDLYFHTFIATGHLNPAFSHVTGDWFGHNRFWLGFRDLPVVHLRYEDLLADPKPQLAFLRDWLGLDEARFEAALAAAAAGTRPDGQFFWKQREKGYFDDLDAGQIALFLKHRGADCAAAGYDPDDIATPPVAPAGAQDKLPPAGAQGDLPPKDAGGAAMTHDPEETR